MVEVKTISEVYNEDCMVGMARFPDNYFDLAVVDPPYGLNVANNTTGTVIRNKSDRDTLTVKDWDKSPPTESYFMELQRVSTNQIIWGGNYFLDILGYCKAPIIWNKKNGDSLYADGEMAWTSVGLPKNLKIWTHQWCGAFKDSERGEKKYHPTQKPVALYDWIYQKYLSEGGKVIDTHLGSGSNRIAANKAGNIDFYGWEIDEEYFNAADRRYRDFVAQTRLF